MRRKLCTKRRMTDAVSMESFEMYCKLQGYRGKLVFNEERLSEYARAVVWYIVKVGFEQKMAGKKIRLKSFVIDYKKYK